jgi:hypothetical protein
MEKSYKILLGIVVYGVLIAIYGVDFLIAIRRDDQYFPQKYDPDFETTTLTTSPRYTVLPESETSPLTDLVKSVKDKKKNKHAAEDLFLENDEFKKDNKLFYEPFAQ